MSRLDNPAGQMPLGVTRGAGKIGAALSYFLAPTVTTFTNISQTVPVRVAKADPFRHFIGFCCPPTTSPGVSLLLCPLSDPLRRSPPAGTLVVSSGVTVQAMLLGFGTFGAMVAGEWWCIGTAPDGVLFVTEQQFLG